MIVLKTLYIDVYFLINFTVDLLAIFASLKLSGIKIRIARSIFCGVIASILAILNLLFIGNTFIRLIIELSLMLFMGIYLCTGVAFRRRAKYIVFFYFTSFLISGVINYVYALLDRYLSSLLQEGESGENRNALIISLLILLIIGVLRILIMVFTNSIGEKSARICIKIDDKTLELDALVDSGNLVKDPMNMSPVLFLKRSVASTIFPNEVMELCDIDRLDADYKKRIRLIPVTRRSETHVMTGIRVDEVSAYNKRGKREIIDVTVVIDKEGGSFGGFEALIPYTAVKDVI